MRSKCWFLAGLFTISAVNGFMPASFSKQNQPKNVNRIDISRLFDTADNADNGIDPNSLMDMDIVLFSVKSEDSASLQLGAMQEDGTLAPLSAWTEEYSFGESIEFLVDEEDRWMKELEFDNVIIHSVLEEDLISYGSRQVGGGKGPGNPHGEESELLYYVEEKVMKNNSMDITLKPELEILW